MTCAISCVMIRVRLSVSRLSSGWIGLLFLHEKQWPEKRTITVKNIGIMYLLFNFTIICRPFFYSYGIFCDVSLRIIIARPIVMSSLILTLSVKHPSGVKKWCVPNKSYLNDLPCILLMPWIILCANPTKDGRFSFLDKTCMWVLGINIRIEVWIKCDFHISTLSVWRCRIWRFYTIISKRNNINWHIFSRTINFAY